MSPPSTRMLRLVGFAVAVVLLGLALYPGTFASPHVTADDTPRYQHAIVPESSAEYEEVTGEHQVAVYRYEDLSPVARELFDRTRAAEPSPRYGGERRYTPDVCRDFLLVCDGYAEDELPAEFTYGTELFPEEAYVFVEDGDERYLLRTGTTGHLFLAPFPTGFVLSWLTMLPLAGLVAVVSHYSGSDRVLGWAVGGGALVGTIGLLAPYVEYAGLVSAWVIGVVLLVAVWLAILASGGYELYRRVSGDGPRSPVAGR